MNFLVIFKQRANSSFPMEPIYLPSHFTETDLKNLLNKISDPASLSNDQYKTKNYFFFIKDAPFTKDISYMADMLNIDSEEKIVIEYDEYETKEPVVVSYDHLYRLKPYGCVSKDKIFVFKNGNQEFRVGGYVRDFCVIRTEYGFENNNKMIKDCRGTYIDNDNHEIQNNDQALEILAILESNDKEIKNICTEETIFKSQKPITILESFEENIIVVMGNKIDIIKNENQQFWAKVKNENGEMVNKIINFETIFEYKFDDDIVKVDVKEKIVIGSLCGEFIILNLKIGKIKIEEKFRLMNAVTTFSLSNDLYYATPKGWLYGHKNGIEILTIRYVNFMVIKDASLDCNPIIFNNKSESDKIGPIMAIASQHEIRAIALESLNEVFRYHFADYIIGMSFYNDYLMVGAGNNVYYFKI